MQKLPELLVCWRCGASNIELPLPLARIAECKSCSAELCVCKMCNFYDTKVAKSCRETTADEVSNKERANFCDYFSLQTNAYKAIDRSAETKAEADLEQLFGLPISNSKQRKNGIQTKQESTLNPLDDLFTK